MMLNVQRKENTERVDNLDYKLTKKGAEPRAKEDTENHRHEATKK